MDGQFAVAAIHEDKEFHRLGAAIVEDGFQRGADRAPGEQHVVDEDDVFIVQRCGDVGLADGGAGVHRGPVVPVQVDVQRAEGQLSPELVFQHLAEADGEVDPAPLDAQQYGLFTVSVTFHDLAGETVENAGDLVGMKKDGGFHGQLLLRSGHVCREGTGSRAP